MSVVKHSRLRSILSGAVPLTALEVITLLLSLLLMPYLMRVLGPAGFGRYAFGVAAAGALVMVVDFGFNQLGPKEVARADPAGAERSWIFWSIQLAKLQIAIVVGPVIAVLAWSLGLVDSYGAVLSAAALGVLTPMATPTWFLQGMQRYKTLALALSLARIGCAAATLLWVHTSADASLAVWLQVSTAPVAGMLALFDRRFRDAVRFQRPRMKDGFGWIRAGRLLFLSTAAISLYTTCVPLLLGVLTTPAVVGLFSAGDKARIAGQTLLQPLTSASFPKLSHWFSEDEGKGLAAARQVMLVQVVAALLGSIAIFLLAGPVIRWVIGVQFLAAVPTAQILGLGLVFTALTNALGVQIMLPLHMERAFTIILGVASLFGLLSTGLLSRIWLDRGAAVAVLGTEILIAMSMALYLRHRGIVVWRSGPREMAIQGPRLESERD